MNKTEHIISVRFYCQFTLYYNMCCNLRIFYISERNIPILLKCDELKKPIYLEFVLNDIFQKDLFSVMDQIGIQILYTSLRTEFIPPKLLRHEISN